MPSHRTKNMGWFATIFVVVMSWQQQHTAHASIKYDMIYWEAPPFIYTDSNGELKGIIVDASEHVRASCLFTEQAFKPLANLRNYTTFKNMLTNPNQSFEFNNVSYPGLKKGTELKAAWFPIFQHIEGYDESLNEIVLVTSLSVITLRDQINFTYKVFVGLKDSPCLYVTAVLMLLTLSIFTWSCEQRVKKSDGFYRGNSRSLWLNCVTMVTVGYGDMVLHTIPGRFLNIIWMMSSLITASLLTGIIWESIVNIRHLDVKDETIAALEFSKEAVLTARNWNAKIQGYQSYEEVFEAVRQGEAKMAVINSATAGFYQNIMNEDKSRPILSVVNTLEFTVPISIALPFLSSTPNRDDLYCFLEELNRGTKNAKRRNERLVQTENIYYPPFEELLHDFSGPYAVCGTFGLILFGLGICFDVSCILQKQLNGNRSGKIAGKSTGNGAEATKKTMDECKREFSLMMAEISDIQQDVDKLTENLLNQRTTYATKDDGKFIINSS